ncbi:MAG: hypothetical protein AAF557_25590 [Pseudomonadota bacterium]
MQTTRQQEAQRSKIEQPPKPVVAPTLEHLPIQRLAKMPAQTKARDLQALSDQTVIEQNEKFHHFQ